MSDTPILRAGERNRQIAEWTLFGRDAACLIRIDDTRVSRTHASLEWKDGGWWLRDLGSQNGTWLDGERLGAEPRLVRRGAKIGLGAADARPWELVSSGPPRPFALHTDGRQEIEAHGDLLVLPEDEDEGQWVVHRRPNGHWIAERGDEQREVTDGDVLTVDEEVWRLKLPGRAISTSLVASAAGPTAGLPWSVESATFVLTRSRDWEHARLTLVNGEHRLDLGDRQCWVVLATLARERLGDAAAAEHDQGWVDIDVLARELGMRRGTVDVYITRARTELADRGVAEAARVVVARRGQRRIGVGLDRLQMEEG